jgi:hypothetical protein
MEHSMVQVPDDPNTTLGRDQTAEALTAAGYPISAKTLAAKATRGEGPPYKRIFARSFYHWGTTLEWAQSQVVVVGVHSDRHPDTDDDAVVGKSKMEEPVQGEIAARQDDPAPDHPVAVNSWRHRRTTE